MEENMKNYFEFTLPFGFEKDGQTYRNGKMRLATTKDELEIQETDEVGMNSRYRDIMFLSKVIVEIDGLKPISTDIIRNLYEADFIYLQLLYRQINNDVGSKIISKCPNCGSLNNVKLSHLYKDMSIYKQ